MRDIQAIVADLQAALAWKQENKKSRAYIHVPQGNGERIADMVASGMGSWRFIIIQTSIVAVWIVVNLIAVFARDPFVPVDSDSS